MTIQTLLWNIFETATIGGLCLFFVSLAASLVSRKWRLAGWRKNFGEHVLIVESRKLSIFKQSLIVALTAFGLVAVLGLFENASCINALYKNKPDYMSYCAGRDNGGDGG